jgi:hypothetical protein
MRVTLVVGRAQQGKTTLALRVARAEAARLLVLDPTGAKALRSVPGVATWRQLATWLAGTHAAGKWELALRSTEPGDYAEVLRCAEHFRHVTLLVDEVLTFASDKSAAPWLVKAARTSAHYGGGTGLNFLMTAQRAMDLPPDARSQVTRLYLFQTWEPGDVSWLAQFTRDEKVRERVAGLAPFEFIELPSTDEAVRVRRLDGSPQEG